MPLILKMMFLSLALSCRALWFVLEILMAKNENNSHAFIRKMIENIKQTKDGQCPDDPKINEVCVILKKCFVFFSCGFMRLILSQQLLLSSISLFSS